MKLYKLIVFLFLFGFEFSPETFAQNVYLEITGATNFETQVIDSLNYERSFSDLKTLFSEIDSTYLKIQRKGYISCEVISTQKTNDSTFTSKWSLKEKIDTLYIYYSKNDLPAEFLKTISDDITDTYFVTTTSKIENTLNFLNSKIAEDGQPFSSVKLIDIKKQNRNSLQAILKIEYGIKRTIDNIVIKGYEKFPKSYLKYYLGLKKEKLFNLEDIKQKTKTINTLPFAKQTRSPEVLFTNDSTELYIYIEKVKTNNFDGFLGFGTNETTNKLEFDGYVNLQLINNLNFGETFLLSYKSDEIDQQTFNANLNLPYLFGLPIGTELELNIFKKDTTFTTTQQSADIFYQLDQYQRVYVGLNSQQSNNLIDENTTNNVEDFDSFFFTTRYEYQKRQENNLLFPINFSAYLQLGFGNRTFESSKEEQQTWSVSVSKIFNLNPSNSISIRGISSALISDTYFSNELLRFGGINSIRGFEENSLLASLYGLVNTEYRYQLSPTIYVHSVLDAAYLDDNLSEVKQNLFGIGFGFGIFTKGGLLKFVYANGKFEDQKFEFSNSKVHLSLTATF